jgi:cell division protein FtsQ
MSSVFALRDRTGRRAESSFARWARPLLILISALCAIALLARFVAVPIMEIRHVIVHSDMPLTDEQVLAISGIHGDEHWYSLATMDMQKRLEANPLIRRAEVRRIFPNTIRMTVWGRQPAALVLAASGGRSLPVLVDGDGVVFKICTTNAEVDLPVISGLDAGETRLGAPLPRVYTSLFADLKVLRERAPALYRMVSEVRIMHPGESASGYSTDSASNPDAKSVAYRDAGLDVLLYLTNSPVPVRARGTIDETLLKYTLMVLDLLSKQGVLKDIQELDFRSGDVVYRMNARSTDAGNARSTDAANARSTDAAVKGG